MEPWIFGRNVWDKLKNYANLEHLEWDIPSSSPGYASVCYTVIWLKLKSTYSHSSSHYLLLQLITLCEACSVYNKTTNCWDYSDFPYKRTMEIQPPPRKVICPSLLLDLTQAQSEFLLYRKKIYSHFLTLFIFVKEKRFNRQKNTPSCFKGTNSDKNIVLMR